MDFKSLAMLAAFGGVALAFNGVDEQKLSEKSFLFARNNLAVDMDASQFAQIMPAAGDINADNEISVLEGGGAEISAVSNVAHSMSSDLDKAAATQADDEWLYNALTNYPLNKSLSY